MDNDLYMFQDFLKNSKSEEGVVARFYDRVVKTDKFNEHGLPVFKPVTYVEIRMLNNNVEVFDQPATEEKIFRFPNEYQRYLLSKKQMQEGTPLDRFAFLERADVESLKERGIFTVEALAELKNDVAAKLGFEKQKNLALKFIEVSKDNQKINEYAQKEAEYKEKIAQLKDEIEQLRAALKEVKKKD